MQIDLVDIKAVLERDGIQADDGILARVLLAVQRAERARILERANEGREQARVAGVQFGRRRAIDRAKLLELKQAGVGGTELAKAMGIGRSTVYKILKSNQMSFQPVLELSNETPATQRPQHRAYG